MSFEPVLLLFPLLLLQRTYNCSGNSNNSSPPSPETQASGGGPARTVAGIATVAVAHPRNTISTRTADSAGDAPALDVMTCDFETLLALEDQMPRERFDQIKAARPNFAAWLNRLRTKEADTRSVTSAPRNLHFARGVPERGHGIEARLCIRVPAPR